MMSIKNPFLKPLKPLTFLQELSTSNGNPNHDRTSIIFTLRNQVGGLARALQVFQELGINVLHIELRPSEDSQQGDVLVDIDCDAKHCERVLKMLRREVQEISFAQTQHAADEFMRPSMLSAQSSFGMNFPGILFWKNNY